MKNIMPPIDTPDNIFHDGNPATGEQGTIVPGLWLTNAQGAIRNTQQELISVLAEAGIEIDESVNNQLSEAIKKIISTGSLLITNNLSEIKAGGSSAIAAALANLTLIANGIGAPTMTAAANFDFQNFVFTSGANYLASSTSWLNAPAGVSYPTGLPISITVDYITNAGNNIGLTLIPNTVTNANFIVYKVLASGAVGSRTFAVRTEWNSANPVPIAGGGTGASTTAVALSNFGLSGGLGAGVIGRLIAKRSITSSGVIPKAAGAKWAIIRAWSAGGGGGGAGRTVTANNASQGWAGQSGSFIEILIDVSALTNYDCVIGLGGLGGAPTTVNTANPGADGGDTTITGILSCPGGKGGQPGVLGTTLNTGIAIVGIALPTATQGTILDSAVSDIGAPGAQLGAGPNQSLGCRGGSAPGGLGSVGGQAGRPIDAGTDGTGGNGKGHAAGGGGGASVSNTTGYGGGNGTDGFISITEFA